MLSMVNANHYISKIAIPTLFIGYAIFLVWEYSNSTYAAYENRRSRVERHYFNVRNNPNLKGIILGGSNAVFSLSAAKLSELTGDRWYNAALINEGFSDANYQNFVSRLAQSINTTEVSYIVYSTIYPFAIGDIDRRLSYRGSLYGESRLTIKPRGSVLGYLKNYLIKGKVVHQKVYPIPLFNGDLDFAKFDCGDFPTEDIKFEREEVSKSSEAIYRSIDFYARLFPKASLVVVFPSEFYGDSFFTADWSDYNDKLERNLSDNILSSGEISLSRVSFVSQPPFPKSEYVCDGRHHANSRGREWRTLNLFQQLK